MRKLKNSNITCFTSIYFWLCLGKCPSPVVLWALQEYQWCLGEASMQTSPFGSSHFSGLPLVKKQVICQPASSSSSMKILVIVLLRMLLEHCGYYWISSTGTWGDLLLYRIRKQLLWHQAMNMRKWLLPHCKAGEKEVEKKTAENLLLSLQSYFLSVTENGGMSKADLYLQQAVALIWRCIPRKTQWEPSCGGGSIWSQSTSRLVLHLQFLFQVVLHCRQVMLKIYQEVAVIFCLRLCLMCQLLGQQAEVWKSSWGM